MSRIVNAAGVAANVVGPKLDQLGDALAKFADTVLKAQDAAAKPFMDMGKALAQFGKDVATAGRPAAAGLANVKAGLQLLAEAAARGVRPLAPLGAALSAAAGGVAAAGAAAVSATKQFASGIQTGMAAAAKLASAAFDGLGATLGKIQAGVTRFVQLADPGAVVRFNLAADRLQAAIGRALAPLLERLTVVFDMAARSVTGFGDGGNKLIATLAALAVGATGAAVAVGAVKVAMAVASGGVVPVLGAITGGLLAIGAAAGFADSPLGGLADAMKPLADAAVGVADQLGAFVGVLGKAVGPAVAEIGKTLTAGFAAIGPTLAAFGEALGRFAGAEARYLSAGFKAVTAAAVKLGEAVLPPLAWTLDNLIVPAIDLLADGLGELPAIIDAIAASVRRLSDDSSDWLSRQLAGAGEALGVFDKGVGAALAEMQRQGFGRGGGAGGPNAPGGRAADFAPNAVRGVSSGGIADLFRKAQEASLLQALGRVDPAKKAEQQRAEQIGAIRDVEKAVKGLRPAPGGAGQQKNMRDFNGA